MQFQPDRLCSLLHGRARRHVVAVGIDADLVEAVGLCPGQGVKFGNRFKIFAKEGKAPGAVIKVGWPNLQTVAAHPERPARKGNVVAPVLLCNQIRDHLALVIDLAAHQIDCHRGIGFNRADAVDARHRGDDDHIVAFQQRPRRRMAHAIDLFVNLGFLFDIGIGPGDIGLGLIIIVVGHEVFDGVVGEEALEFAV